MNVWSSSLPFDFLACHSNQVLFCFVFFQCLKRKICVCVSQGRLFIISGHFLSLQHSFHLTILIQQILLKHGLGHRQSPEVTDSSSTYNLVNSYFIYTFIFPPLECKPYVSYMKSGNSVVFIATLLKIRTMPDRGQTINKYLSN